MMQKLEKKNHWNYTLQWIIYQITFESMDFPAFPFGGKKS